MKKNILVVDDETEMRIALSKAISIGGYEVESASDGYEAINKIRHRSYDLIVTDVRMPKMDGVSLLNQIKTFSPQTAVVLITAHGSVENAVAAMKRGADDYILKPFSFDLINKVIKKVLAKKQSENISNNNSSNSEEKPFITQNKELLKILSFAKSVANSNATVLIQGESGTGKELLARYIHNNSNRKDMPFIAVNCASLPEGLLESELFGHEKGAFTGAISKKEGKFELANGGTLLLDEITEMKFSLQAKLLRVLQEGEIDRVGGKKPIKTDVRIIATTNRDIKEHIKKGEFRQDLFFRLNVIPLKIIPLRKRKDDIKVLAEYFLKRSCEKNGKPEIILTDKAVSALENHSWPGNVRELENLIERAVLLCEDEKIEPKHLLFDYQDEHDDTSFEIGDNMTIKEMEKKLILSTLKKTEGNRTKAANMLQISIRTLRNKLKEYQINS
ncbi:MAG: sigma-54-dependent Fis family transcriptional regulator [Candidatus Schekmanbacteria bacterium]|nr:MAG: sigma-54-dependent Fis family transcriptional regulator [Candidatus Schekmanbacteria bacterium]